MVSPLSCPSQIYKQNDSVGLALWTGLTVDYGPHLCTNCFLKEMAWEYPDERRALKTCQLQLPCLPFLNCM